MNFKEVLQSKSFQKIIYVIGAFVFILVVFRAGVYIGYRKAGFSYGAGNNYYKIFVNPRGELPPSGGSPGFFRDDFESAHGAIGRIIQVSLPKLIVEDRDGIEKAIFVGSDTAIRQSRETIASSSLKVNDFIAVVGSPASDGYIQAKLVRILPPPPILPITR
jgi:hypothetical protein